MDFIFKCEQINKNYEDIPVIENISIELQQGNFISLLGPSGVGKTTLFNVLSGVDKPDGGKVFLHGEDITGVCGKVSYMLQKDLLLEYRTVIDNVILPLVIRGEKKNIAREHAVEFFPIFGLEGYEKKYPSQLSGGMRQRAALLRTCMTTYFENDHTLRNPVILLDEPFSSLDSITRRKMQTWYSGIAEQFKISTIFITHDAEEALILSDTVCVMTGKPGRITQKINVNPARPRDADFSISKEFLEQKRVILKAVEE